MQTGIIALVGLATMFIGWIITLILPALGPAAWGILAVGAMLLLLAFVVDYRRVGSAIVSRRGRFSTGTTLMISVFAGIILLVNAISIGNSKRFDVTGFAAYTLTTQTKKVLEELDTDVDAILYFVSVNDPYGAGAYADNLLTEYQSFTDRLDVTTVDPEERPDQAREHGVSQSPSVVFIGQNGDRLVQPLEILAEAEHAFTSAILEVTGTVQLKVLFVSGHGEVDIYDTTPRGYSKAREGLKDNLFKTATVDLLAAKTIPDDIAAVVIASPRAPYSEAEKAIIADYLDRDGRVLFLFDPNTPEDFADLLSEWGVSVESGVIWEQDEEAYAAPSRDSPLVPRLRNLLGLTTLYFPGSTAITPAPGYVPEITATESGLPIIFWASEHSDIVLYSLARSSQSSWLETESSVSEDPQFDEDVDIAGPLSIGFYIAPLPPQAEDGSAAADADDGARLAILGDSDFATNKHFLNGDNATLFLSAVNFLTAGTDLISIDRKVLQERRFVVSPGALRFINYSSVGLLPLLVFVIGGIIWWRRH